MYDKSLATKRLDSLQYAYSAGDYLVFAWAIAMHSLHRSSNWHLTPVRALAGKFLMVGVSAIKAWLGQKRIWTHFLGSPKPANISPNLLHCMTLAISFYYNRFCGLHLWLHPLRWGSIERCLTCVLNPVYTWSGGRVRGRQLMYGSASAVYLSAFFWTNGIFTQVI